MRLLAALLAAVIVAPAAFALWPLPETMSVTDSSHHPGASVSLTLLLRYEMQCGWPGSGPLAVTLPQAFKLASQTRALVDGKPAPLTRTGQRLALPLPPRHGVMCDVIGPGTLTVRLGPLRNPRQPGTYLIRASRGPDDFQTTVRIGVVK